MNYTLFRAFYVLLGQAGQAVEPAARIPLQMRAPRGAVVLVGDPQQLPATVLSRAAQKAGLPLSLFERLQQVHILHATCAQNCHNTTLGVQCRLHADDCSPSSATEKVWR